MGLRDIERKIKTSSAFQVKDAEMLLLELDKMIEGAESLKQQLKKFEKEHGKQIKDTKEYYDKVALIRRQLGLPEELGVYEWKESPSLKDKLTGGGYYEQLGLEILEFSKSAVKSTGGIISVAELVLKINRARPGKLVSSSDVVKSLEQLVKDKLIQPLRQLPSGVLIAEFIAAELNEDQNRLLDLASRDGFLTEEKVLVETAWTPERVHTALEQCVTKGIAIKDTDVTEGIKYWFPSFGY